MRAARYVVKVQADGKLDVPAIGLEPGSDVEVIVLSNGDAGELNLSEVTAILSQDAFARIWNTPEEDEAWKDL